MNSIYRLSMLWLALCLMTFSFSCYSVNGG